MTRDRRNWRQLSLETLTPKVTTRFWSKVDRSAGPDECWPWLDHTVYGYGQIWVAGRDIVATRVAYLLANGHIDDRFVCHDCDNPPCVNPAHLFLGTNSDNQVDSVAKGRHREARKSHCPAGHAYAGTNLYVGPDGSRRCRRCAADRALLTRAQGVAS